MKGEFYVVTLFLFFFFFVLFFVFLIILTIEDNSVSSFSNMQWCFKMFLNQYYF